MKRGVRREGALWTQWEKTLRRGPRRIVLIDAATDVSLTAHALHEAARSLSSRLIPYRAGARIAFRLPNGSEWLALFLALQRAGLTAVPLDGGLPAEGCFETARQMGARALYLEGEFHPLGRLPARGKKGACIKLTSGTGGAPKAIACKAEHLLADGRNIIRTMGLRGGDLNLAAIPLGHSYGLGNLVMPLILQGTAMVCAGDFLPRQLVEWIGRYRVTVFPGVPALFRVLAALPPGLEVPSLRTAISAGAILRPEVARAFLERYGVKVHNFYGSSETGGICYDRTGNASLTGRSVGKPLAGVSVGVEQGRITVKSRAVATPSGSWRLPDRGEWNGRGELALHGRMGQGANIGGKKVHPLEVERVLRSLPGVTDVIVWLVAGLGRDQLAAAVETRLSRVEVEKALAAKLPAWKWPKAYLIASELPRTARGKLDLSALRLKAG
jgi:acyl-CoA synthetase (AMP-forming)/AMP-acid ligase II